MLVSVLCLYLSARGIQFRSLLEAFRQVQVEWILLALGLLVLVDLARARRWRLLLQPLAKPRVGRLFFLLNIGYLVSNFSPMRMGELLRAFLCARLERIGVASALSTIAVERLVDALVVALLLLALVPFVALPPELLRPAVGVGLLAAALFVVLAAAVSRRRNSLQRYEQAAQAFPFLRREALRRTVVAALDGFATLGSWPQALRLGAWTLIIWLAGALDFSLLLRSMGLRLPASAGLLLICVTSLGMVVPSSPGYVGVFEYLTVVSLSVYGVSREVALGSALVLHAALYLKSLVLGLIGLWMEGYSYTRLRETLARAQTEPMAT